MVGEMPVQPCLELEGQATLRTLVRTVCCVLVDFVGLQPENLESIILY